MAGFRLLVKSNQGSCPDQAADHPTDGDAEQGAAQDDGGGTVGRCGIVRG